MRGSWVRFQMSELMVTAEPSTGCDETRSWSFILSARLEVGKEATGKLRAEVSLPVGDGLCCCFLALTLDIMNSAVKH